MLLHDNGNVAIGLTQCISCTIENVSLIGCGLSGSNLIGKSYLCNIVINLTKSSNREYTCYDQQGITLYYYSNSSLKEKNLKIAHDQESIIIMQKISVNHDNSQCYTNKGIINIQIQPNNIVDSLEIKISDSQFNQMIQTIITIKDDSRETMCMIWIVNCTFESDLIDHGSSIITVELPSFNATLISFKCKFHNNKLRGYLVLVNMKFNANVVTGHRSIVIACTNITFNECDFVTNKGGFLYLENMDLPYCKPGVLLTGTIDNELISVESTGENMIYIHNMHIY